MPDLFTSLALIECSDRVALDEALAAGLDGLVVQRISETVVVVDHERLAMVLKLLRRQGQTPKVSTE